jgi:uncharacterized oligopeptide transporter (OPT) family protein
MKSISVLTMVLTARPLPIPTSKPFYLVLWEALKRSRSSFEYNSVDVYISGIVPETDDPSIPSLTFRVVLLGTLWNVFLATINSIFMFRTTLFLVPTTVATLLSYPMGIFLARSLSTRRLNHFGFQWSMNPGPFTVKEHVLVSIIASAGGGVAYGVENVVVQKFSNFMVLDLAANCDC